MLIYAFNWKHILLFQTYQEIVLEIIVFTKNFVNSSFQGEGYRLTYWVEHKLSQLQGFRQPLCVTMQSHRFHYFRGHPKITPGEYNLKFQVSNPTHPKKKFKFQFS